MESLVFLVSMAVWWKGWYKWSNRIFHSTFKQREGILREIKHCWLGLSLVSFERHKSHNLFEKHDILLFKNACMIRRLIWVDSREVPHFDGLVWFQRILRNLLLMFETWFLLVLYTSHWLIFPRTNWFGDDEVALSLTWAMLMVYWSL